jgi:hypothetical protein
VPEVPRLIGDLVGTYQKLPFPLQGKGEFEYVGRKVVGNGCGETAYLSGDPNALNDYCVGVPNKEFRLAVARPFLEGRLNVGVNMMRGCQTQLNLSFSFARNTFLVIGEERNPTYRTVLALQPHVEGHLRDIAGVSGEVHHRNPNSLKGCVVGKVFRFGERSVPCDEINGVSITSKATIRQQGCQIAVKRLVFPMRSVSVIPLVAIAESQCRNNLVIASLLCLRSIAPSLTKYASTALPTAILAI